MAAAAAAALAGPARAADPVKQGMSVRVAPGEVVSLLGRNGVGYVPENRDIFPNLSVSQNLSLARTLMGDPTLMMVDEPTEGLAPRIVRQVRDLLAEAAHRGVSALLVEQKLDIALQLSQRIDLMGHGRIVHEGEPQALMADTALCQEWLGV